MFQQRLVTGLILAIGFFLIAFSLPTAYVALCLFAVIMLGTWEWTRLAFLRPTEQLLLYVGVAVCCLAAYSLLKDVTAHGWLLWMSLLWWSGISIVLIRYKPMVVDHDDWMHRLSKSMMALVVFTPAFFSLVVMHDYKHYGNIFFLYAFLLVWCADVGAYAAGKMFGKHKLLPNVSPGKTIEGVIGGLLCVAVLSCVYSVILELSFATAAQFICLSMVIGLFSVFGDLFQSVLKRQADMKDSSNLLPGHGGVLDRIDSVLAAAPLLLLLISHLI